MKLVQNQLKSIEMNQNQCFAFLSSVISLPGHNFTRAPKVPKGGGNNSAPLLAPDVLLSKYERLCTAERGGITNLPPRCFGEASGAQEVALEAAKEPREERFHAQMAPGTSPKLKISVLEDLWF